MTNFTTFSGTETVFMWIQIFSFAWLTLMFMIGKAIHGKFGPKVALGPVDRQKFSLAEHKSRKGNFLVLHCASPSAHTIATSKMAVISYGRRKEIIMAPFIVLLLLIAILIILPGFKGFCLESCPSSLAQNDHLKPKLSLCCRFGRKRGRLPPPYLFVSCIRYGYTKNIY